LKNSILFGFRVSSGRDRSFYFAAVDLLTVWLFYLRELELMLCGLLCVSIKNIKTICRLARYLPLFPAFPHSPTLSHSPHTARRPCGPS